MRRLTVLIVLGAVMCGCCRLPGPRQPHIVHVVVVWLKNPGNEVERKKLIDTASGFVGKIPGLIKVEGGPALPSTRPFVDSTFDVVVVMTFDSERSLQEYNTHPVHIQAVKEVLQPLAGKVVVYDAPDRE
jgi:hypothetical protein